MFNLFLKVMFGTSASVSYVCTFQKNIDVRVRESAKEKIGCASDVPKENKAHVNVCLKREREWNVIVLS